MKSNKYLTIGLLTGFIVGGCIGVLAWAFLQNLFAISICAGMRRWTLWQADTSGHFVQRFRAAGGTDRRPFFLLGKEVRLSLQPTSGPTR